MRNIQTVAQLHDLQNETYVYAAIVVIAIFGVSFLLAQLTPYKGGNDRSYITRRIWWFISMAVGSLGFWLYNQLYVMPFIKKSRIPISVFHHKYDLSWCNTRWIGNT
jgi:hypothetical protein